MIGSAFGNLASRIGCIFNDTTVPYTFVSDSIIICLSPARKKGTITPVQVTYDNGTYFSNSEYYGYYGGVLLTPSIGPYKGGTMIYIQSSVLTCNTYSGPCLPIVASQPVACRFWLQAGQNKVDTPGVVLVRDKVRVVACSTPRAIVNSTPNTANDLGLGLDLSKAGNQFNYTGLAGVQVSFTLLGPAAFSDPADSLSFFFYPDPVLVSVVPTFASGAGGCTATIFGTGFLPFLGQRLRFAGNDTSSEWSTAVYVSPTIMIANVSKRCASRQQESCAAAPLYLVPSVSLSVNGQQYTGNSLDFRYYDVSSITPSGGSTEGGTPFTVFGTGFDLIRKDTPVKCRFSHNFVESPATMLSQNALMCIAPQGRQRSSVEVCIGTNYSSTMPELVGCRNSYTANHVQYISYSLYPLISIRPDSGPSAGTFPIAILLDSFLYSSLQLSLETFRVYGSVNNVKCKFAGINEVPATVVSTTRALCLAPPYSAARDELGGSNSLQITLNGWDWSQTTVYLKYQIITAVTPFGSPSTCTEPLCQTSRLICDWCTIQPDIDVQIGTCQTWEPAYVNGFRVKPTVITVTGINLDEFSPSRNVEGGYPYPLCKLGSLNIFNASFVAGGLMPVAGQLVTSFQLTCPLPTKTHMALEESPALILEVSLNGRDFTASAEARKLADVWATRVRNYCPPIVSRMRPSSGTSASLQRALVTLQGQGFQAAQPTADGVNAFAKCQFGGDRKSVV